MVANPQMSPALLLSCLLPCPPPLRLCASAVQPSSSTTETPFSRTAGPEVDIAGVMGLNEIATRDWTKASGSF